MNSKQIIQLLNLKSHPEGGYFREIYRSERTISLSPLNNGPYGQRNLATSIYYLLEYGQFSKLHRLKSDEIWYFHGGGPIQIVCAWNGRVSTKKLGFNLQMEEIPQIILKGGTIFGATPLEKDSYTLVGCLVTPGFDFSDFEFVTETEIINDYPNHTNTLNKYL